MKEWAKNLLLVTVAFLTPIQAVLITVGALVWMDFLTGIAASIKNKIPITSYGFKRTVVKVCVYEMAIVLAYVVQLYLTGPAVPVLHLASSLIGLTELKSVYENLNIISGGSLLTTLISSIQNLSSNDPPPPTA